MRAAAIQGFTEAESQDLREHLKEEKRAPEGGDQPLIPGRKRGWAEGGPAPHLGSGRRQKSPSECREVKEHTHVSL